MAHSDTATRSAEARVELPDVSSDLGFTEEHGMLATSARRWLEQRAPMSVVRKLVDDPVGYDASSFRELAQMGWLDLGTLDRLHLALLFEEMGRTLYPSPYFATVLALDALRTAGMTERVEPIAVGERIASFALSEPSGAWESEHLTTRAEPKDGGFELTGTKTLVLFASCADLVLVPCREPDGGIGVFVVDLPSERARIEPHVTVDPTRRAGRLELDRVRLDQGARLAGDGRALLERVSMLGEVLLAAEMCGAASAVLERTRTYACERQQFGRAIGSFQAVKHPIVDMLVNVELARSLALGAAALMKQDDSQARVSARMAKAYAGDALAYAVKKGVQLHGGFGFTWDCDVQLYFKRMLWSRSTLGDATHHRAKLGAQLFGGS